MSEIYFAGGCFWGTEHLFKQVRGVVSTAVGYANGNTADPTYEDVYTDTTGYAECVRVEYDERVVTLETLTQLFFRSIDPLSLNRQGLDCGTRYRTGIYYIADDHVATLRRIYDDVETECGAPLAVELMPLEIFYPAEEYHQDYLDKNPAGYCHLSKTLFDYARTLNR